MFVSKKKFDELETKVLTLEAELKSAKIFTYYAERTIPDAWGGTHDIHEITYYGLLYKILDHLGLELKHESAKSGSVKLVKKKKVKP